MFPIIVLLAELVFLIIATILQGILAGVVMLLAIGITIVFFYYAAKNKQQASFVKEGTIEFVVAGETLLRVLENVRGWHYHEGPGGSIKLQKPEYEDETLPDGTVIPDGKIRKIVDDGEIPVENAIVKNADPTGTITKWQKWINERWPPKKYLQRRWGFFWVHALYPGRKIHRFTLRHKRKKTEDKIATLPPEAPLTQWLEIDPLEEGADSSLLWRFPRPIIVEGVEFTDLFEGDIFLQAQFQIVVPERPIFIYRSKEFFSLLESAVAAAVIDYTRSISYAAFIRQTKTGATSPFFWKVVNPLNRVAPGHPRGLISELGVQVIDAWIEYVALSKGSQRTKDALTAQKIAELEGDAEVMKANKHARAIRTVAKADAAALTAQLTAAGVTPDVIRAKFAVDIARLQIEKADKIKSGVTWVEGGNALLTIPAPPATPTPTPAPPTP